MRRLWMIPAMLVIFGVMIGCGGSDTEQAADTNAETPADQAAATEEAAEKSVPEAPPVEMASVSLSGKMGCGHCTFNAKDSCSLAMQAEDGTVYFLETGDRQEELMEKRYDEPAIKIAGRIAEVDGQKVIYTDTVELF